MGYEPKIIRDHRLGLLPAATNVVAHGGGETASSEFIAALRNYAKSLAPGDRTTFLNEFKRYSGPTSDNGYDPNQQLVRTAPANELIAAASFTGLSTEASQLLRQILATPPPALGEFFGAAAPELRDLRQLLRTQQSTAVRQRLQQQFQGYASPPSDNGAGDP